MRKMRRKRTKSRKMTGSLFRVGTIIRMDMETLMSLCMISESMGRSEVIVGIYFVLVLIL